MGSDEGTELDRNQGEPPKNLSGSFGGKLALCCHLVAVTGAVPTGKNATQQLCRTYCVLGSVPVDL